MSRINRSNHDLFLAFSKLVTKHAKSIEQIILLRNYNSISSPGPFQINYIYDFINLFHLPFVHAREGMWSDNPKDNGGATMRGVTLSTFRKKFDKIYDLSSYGINDAEYNSLFNQVKQTQYKTDPLVGKDLLRTILTPKDNLRPFIALYYTTSNVNGLEIATYDPYLAFLLIDKTWMSGGYAWSNIIQNGSIYSAAKSLGFTGSTPHYATRDFVNWVKQLNATTVRTTALSNTLIQNFVNHASGIASKKKSQAGFLKGWLARFVGSPRDKRLNYVSVGNKWIEYLTNIS